MAALSRNASASTRASTRRTRLVTAPGASSSTAGNSAASTAAHDSRPASHSSAAMIVARQESRSPALIAANVAGSLDANAAAASTLREAATGPIASIGPKQSAANSPRCPTPWSTSTHAPDPSCSCSRPANWATRNACTAEAALITRCAPSTSAARSREGMNIAPAAASSKASRINVSACENLSIMCSILGDPDRQPQHLSTNESWRSATTFTSSTTTKMSHAGHAARVRHANSTRSP